MMPIPQLTPEIAIPACVNVFGRHPEYRDVFALGDSIDLLARAFV